MEPITIGIVMSAIMLVLLLAGVPIGFAMGSVAVVGSAFIIGPAPTLFMLGQTAYETAITYDLSIVPLFILMGIFASNSGADA